MYEDKNQLIDYNKTYKKEFYDLQNLKSVHAHFYAVAVMLFYFNVPKRIFPVGNNILWPDQNAMKHT